MVSGGSNRDRIYWDACVWLSYINGYADRQPILDALLADSNSPTGQRHIVTSTISQTEVAFALVELNNKALDPNIESLIDQLWSDKEAITLIEYHSVIAYDARDLIRMGLEHGWSLKPLDAIHLATANWFECTEFHTYDSRLERYAQTLGFSISEPFISGGLPATQSDFLDEPK